MAKKGLVIGLVALGTAALGVIALSKKAEAAPAPTPPPKYYCVWKDGFTADTWEGMLEHYRTVHPSMAVLDFLDIQWTDK